MGDLPYLPFDIKVDIFRRLGEQGFKNLGPVLAAGRVGRDAVFTPEVLHDSALDEFMFFGSMALEGSHYRTFLLKCVEQNNMQAKYIEAVRILKQEGDKMVAFNYLNESMGTNKYARFALAMFLFCTGSWEDAFGVLSMLWDVVQNLDEGIQVAHIVIGQIQTMWLPPAGLFEETYEYPEVPWCVYVSCNAEDVCMDCFPFWYSRLICAMC